MKRHETGGLISTEELTSNSWPGRAEILPPPEVPDHELLRPIGRGAYGEVWIARSVTGQFRAVKIVRRSSFEEDRPFEREFEGIRRFEPISRRHDSQVDILHVGRGENYFYYVMELADDQSSGGQIDPDNYHPRTIKSDLVFRGRIPFEECLAVGVALTTALENLHQNGLVHRDVKPSNIIFVNGVAKLADIGLVTGLDRTRSFVGTEGFAAPEGPGSPQADLFSLGKVLYEMATGKDRQEFPELPADLREFPDRAGLVELNAVILRACRHDPKDRYPSATQMRTELELLQSGRSLARLHWVQQRLRWVGRAAGALALLTFALMGGWFYHARHNRVLLQLAQERALLAEENARLAEFERLKLLEESVVKTENKTLIILAGPITNSANGHRYYLLDNSGPTEAELHAGSLGGHLATIRNAEEQRWVFETFANWNGIPRHLWIGLYHPDAAHGSTNREDRRREFRWRSGEPVSYVNWDPEEPNSWSDKAEGSVRMRPPGTSGGGRWKSGEDATLLVYGVVEVTPSEHGLSSKELRIIAGPVTSPVNKHLYYLLDCAKPTEAQRRAESLGGHLATLRNAHEEQWVFETFAFWQGIPRHLCIGLYHPNPTRGSTILAERRREFRWRSGEPVGYMNWGRAEPNSFEGTVEPYVNIWAPTWREPGAWNDMPDMSMIMGIGVYGIVEVVPDLRAK